VNTPLLCDGGCAVLNSALPFNSLRLWGYQKVSFLQVEKKNAMRHLNHEPPAPNRVVAIFEGSAVSFDMAPAATFEDLAERLSYLHDRHEGTLISVAVRFHA
jgi:hypothetical protein